jgi:hypothetical protein
VFDVSTGLPRCITTLLVHVNLANLYQDNLTPDYISNLNYLYILTIELYQNLQ